MPQELLLLIAGASISIVSSILTLIVGNIFQRKNDERKREWELDDKRTNKKIEIKEARIKAAREYYDTHIDIVKSLRAVQQAMFTNWKSTDSKTAYDEDFAKIDGLMISAIKKLGSIAALGDKELKDAAEELRDICWQELVHTREIQKKIGSNQKADLEAMLKSAEEYALKVGGALGEVAGKIESLVGLDT